MLLLELQLVGLPPLRILSHWWFFEARRVIGEVGDGCAVGQMARWHKKAELSKLSSSGGNNLEFFSRISKISTLEIGALSFWCIQVVKCSTIIWFERSTLLLAFSWWNWCCWRNNPHLMFGNIFESFNWTLKECWEVYFDGGIQSSTLHKSKESVRGDFELFLLEKKSSQNGKTCVAAVQ